MKNDGSIHRVRFGPYSADLHTQELWHGDIRMKLGRQPFQILEMLILSPGQLVTREDLQRRLWPEDHFVDASHGLNAAVNKLRDTLHDSADEPRYIETLPRRGYRFIGSVDVETSPAIASAAVQTLQPADPVQVPETLAPLPAARIAAVPSSAMPRWPILAVASVALIVGSGIGIILTNAVRKPKLNGFAPQVETPRIEAYAMEAKRRAEPEVQLRPTRSGVNVVPAEITRSQADSLWRPEAHGLLQTADFRTIVPGNTGNAAPQFSPDGKRIAFMSNRTGPWQIWMSNEDGSNPVQVSFTDSAGTPRWSPDGQSIAFDAPVDGTTCVFVAPINRPESAHPVAEGRVPSFSRDGKYVYFASERTDDWQIWKVPVAGGPAIQVTNGGGFAALESPDGNLYYTKSEGNPLIWKIAAAGGVESAVSPLVRPRTWSSWTVTKNGILLAVDLPDGKTHLNLYDPARATMHELVTLQSAPHWMGATVDGRKVVVNDDSERQITMLDNLR
jgi:DNA-binding winged helix-turn-helix (wHTH) protein